MTRKQSSKDKSFKLIYFYARRERGRVYCKRAEPEVPDRVSNNAEKEIRQKEMPRDRIELSTPGFSDQCSTTELPRHYSYIILN